MLNYQELRKLTKEQREKRLREQNWAGMVLAACMGLAFICMLWALLAPVKAHASAITIITVEGYTTEAWANAIRHAEGNNNYGILTHYKHTTYRRACINTVLHKHRDWVKLGRPGTFLHYLASKYAPIGVSNDPNGLNRNWESNVKYWLALKQ